MVIPECPRASAFDLQREDQADDGVGQRIAYARRVREQEVALITLELFGRYASLGQQAKAGVDAVRGVADRDDLIDQGTGNGNAAAVMRRQRRATGCS